MKTLSFDFKCFKFLLSSILEALKHECWSLLLSRAQRGDHWFLCKVSATFLESYAELRLSIACSYWRWSLMLSGCPLSNHLGSKFNRASGRQCTICRILVDKDSTVLQLLLKSLNSLNSSLFWKTSQTCWAQMQSMYGATLWAHSHNNAWTQIILMGWDRQRRWAQRARHSDASKSRTTWTTQMCRISKFLQVV